ncbi:mpv17-like protein 2 [Epargyreus clarus]|uniref:mpv17-like protein 2 n=1 Tax=Epargyreus clarus TaxID=520877 RepID=UPI003C2ED158
MFTIRSLRITRVIIPLRSQSRPKSSFYRGVNFFFKNNLLLINSVTSGGFMAIGDLVQQEIEYQSKISKHRYDWARVARMFIVGTFMGPLHHYYYLYLDKMLPLADIKTVLKKIMSDQLFASPGTIICFFYGMAYLERKTLQESTNEIKEKFKYVYLGDCLFWPPVQFLNFYFLPTHYRVFYINFATMIFNIFLSYMKHYDQHKK